MVLVKQEYPEMKAQRVDLDRISTLPPPIIEDILCRLYSIQETVRTSILSREWRYKWTKIPKIVFNEVWFKQPTDGFWSRMSNEEEAKEMKKMDLKYKVLDTIYQVLIMHQSSIHEFTLGMKLDQTNVDLNNIISILSRKHALKKLKFRLTDKERWYYCVPSTIFSLHQLTNLYLYGCDLNYPPTFSGFGNLTTLYLEAIYIPDRSLLHLLSKCPLLKDCTLILNDQHIICENNCTIFELFQCLPAIERLTTWTWILHCYCYDQESIPKKLPISLLNLKYFSLTYMDCSHTNEFDLLALVMTCSPNLEKIKIQISQGHFRETVNSVISRSCSYIRLEHIRLEHLNELEIIDFDNSKPDFEFVKFILATAPELKKVHLCFYGSDELDEDEESELVRSLLQSPPASPAIKIIVTAKYFEMGFDYYGDSDSD